MALATRQAIGMRIRQLRKVNGLSQTKLALMVGVERSYLARVEAGSRNVSALMFLKKIADGFGMSLSNFLRDLNKSISFHRLGLIGSHFALIDCRQGRMRRVT